jgi:ribonuclease T
MTNEPDFQPMGHRFRGFLPVVVDVETGGFNPQSDALLQVAAVLLRMDSEGRLYRHYTVARHVQPFEGANMDPKSLEVNGINPFHPLRIAHPEKDALATVFRAIREEMKLNACKRAILVGHNAGFDLSFINQGAERAGLKRNPFHPFSSLDTVTLSAMAFGQTVLARAVQAAGMGWDNSEAHSAVYDAEKTAELFCHVLNRWGPIIQPSVDTHMDSG